MTTIEKTNLHELSQEMQNLILKELKIDWFNITSMSEKTANEVIKLIKTNFPDSINNCIIYLENGEIIT